MSGELPQEAKEALANNGFTLDVSALAEEFTFIRDMNEIEIGTAFALYQTGCELSAAGLLQLEQNVVQSASRRTSVQRLIKILVKSDLQTSGIKKAYDALTEVMDDNGESANARIRAAETVLKWSGEIGKEQDKGKEDELSAMSIGELESVISKLQAKKDELSKDMIEHQG